MPDKSEFLNLSYIKKKYMLQEADKFLRKLFINFSLCPKNLCI